MDINDVPVTTQPVDLNEAVPEYMMKLNPQLLESQIEVLAVINQIGQALTTSLHTMDVAAISRSILRNLRWKDLFVFDSAEICLWQTQTKELTTVMCFPEADFSPQTYRLGEGYAGWIAAKQLPLLIEDASQYSEVVPKNGPERFAYRSYIGVPLKVGLKFIGTIELAAMPANVYHEQDVTVLEIIASQAAITLDHVRLFQETQRNVAELALLIDASSELSSTLSYDQLLQNLSRQMLNAFPADDCAIFNFDEATGALKLIYYHDATETDRFDGSIAGLNKEALARLIVQTPAWQTALKSHVPLIIRRSDGVEDAKEIELLQFLDSGTVVAVPLISRDKLTGLLVLFSPDPNDFTEYQIQLAQSLVNQASIALDNARLFSMTDQQLQSRIDELAGLQRASRELNSTLDLDKILNLVLEETMQVTKADFGSISLYEAQGGKLVAHKEQGELAILEAHWERLTEPPNGPVVLEEVFYAGKTMLIPDINYYEHYLARGKDTCSTVVIPVYYGGEPIGLINLESKQRNFFNESQLGYLEALANQAAVAIGNAQAFQEQKREREQASRRAEQLSRLSEISNAFRTNRPLREVLEDIAYAILESVGYKVVLVSLVSGNPPVIYHEVAAGIPLAEFETYKRSTEIQPLSKLREIMREEFRLSDSYFIPVEHRDVWQGKLQIPSLGEFHPIASISVENRELAWRPGDLLFVPLYDTDERIIGILTVENPDTGERPTSSSVQTLEIFANQAATAIENARLFELERQRRRLADTLRGVAEAISSKLDFDELLNIMLQELAKVVEFDSVSVQQLQGNQLIIIGGHGWDSQQVVGLTFSMAGKNPNRVVIETQEPLIINNAPAEYPESFMNPPHDWIRSWLGVPLTYGTNVLGLMALDSSQTNFFTQEDAQVVLAFANQVAVAMQNALLFEEQRHQVRQLAALTEVAQALNRALDLDELLNLVLDAVFDLTERSQGSIWLIDYIDRTVKIANTKNISDFMVDLFNASNISVETEPFASVITSGEVLTIRDDAISNANIAQYASPFPGDVTYVPLKIEDNVIGILAIEGLLRGKNMLQLITTLADLAAIAIDNAKLVQQLNQFNEELEQRVTQRTEELAQTLKDLRQERDRVETLYQITRELSTSFDLDRILTQALNLIHRAMGVSHGSILLLDRNTGKLIYRAGLGHRRPFARGGYETDYRLGYGLAGKVMQERELRIIPDLLEDPDWIPKKSTPDRRSAIVAPLVAGDEAVGTLLLFHHEVNFFSENHAKLVAAAGTQVANAINNAELYRLITDQANRLGVMLRTQAAEATKNETILRGIADGVLVLDADRHIVLLNPKAAEILAINPEKIENQPLDQILERVTALESFELVQLFYHNLLAALEKVRKGERAVEFRIEHGKKAMVITLASISFGAEELPSVVSVIRDISKEAEIDRLRKEFISTVSHELRTPMTSIKGYADLLMSGDARVGQLSPTQERFVKVIQSNANRLTGLVNDILEISRMDTDRIKLEFEGLDLAEVIREVALSFEGQLVQKPLTLRLDLPDDLPRVYADRARLVQILVNLIGNAWQYTPQGGSVTVQAKVLNENFVQVDVIDTGIGIVEEDLPYIFDRFFRSERTEVQVVDGTGLGLSITRGFVEMLGGKIWAQSEVDVGSTFSFTVPVEK